MSIFLTPKPLTSHGAPPCGFFDWLRWYRAEIVLQKALWDSPKWFKTRQNSKFLHSNLDSTASGLHSIFKGLESKKDFLMKINKNIGQ
jgi:hypothetical protein